MDTTLGKRIINNRKKLGLTQDKLAEALGVTAQAVSKWENDQSCPDITMLPRLAELFHITTDELLGVKQKDTMDADQSQESVACSVIVENSENRRPKHSFEFRHDFGKRDSIAFAVLVLAVGLLTLLSTLFHGDISFWSILWPCTVIWLGVTVLLRKVYVFGIASILFGGYSLLENLEIIHLNVSWKLVFPILILLLGTNLLVEAFKRPKHNRWHFHHGTNSGESPEDQTPKNDFWVDGETFCCALAFGETTRSIFMDRLSSADISCSFGELTVDLRGISEFADDCRINASCSFGELKLLVPRSVRVEPNTSTAFGGIEFEGTADADAKQILNLDGNASFGEIFVCYI